MLGHFSHVRLCVTLQTAAHQDPLSTGFSRQEYWSGLPFPSLNILSRLVITFLPRGKHLFITWLQSPSAMILENQTKNKVWHCFHCFSIYCHEVMGPDAMIFVSWMLSFKATFLFFFFNKCIYFNQRLITLQCCIGFGIHQHESATSGNFSTLLFSLSSRVALVLLHFLP